MNQKIEKNRRIVKAICRGIMKVFFKTEIHGLENMPKDGPLIVCGNHISFWDVVFLQVPSERLIGFVAKKELFKIPVVGYITKLFGSIPLDRSRKDIKAARQMNTYLKQGNALGLFPEGTRLNSVKKGKKKYGIKSGAVKLAYENDILVLPVGINASYKLFSKVIIQFGKPHKIKIDENINSKSKAFKEASLELIKEIYDLAGVENEYIDS